MASDGQASGEELGPFWTRLEILSPCPRAQLPAVSQVCMYIYTYIDTFI